MASHAPGRSPAHVERTLHAVLLAAAALITAGALALIITMDPQAASQGARFLVALGALVFLGTLETHVVSFARRYWPLELGAREAERRCIRTCMLVLFSAAAVLLGAAVLLPSP